MTVENFFRICFFVTMVTGLARAMQYGVKKWSLHKWRPRLNRSAKRFWHAERLFWTIMSAGLTAVWTFVAAEGTNVGNGLWPFVIAAGAFALVAVVYDKIMKIIRCKMAAYTRRQLPGYIRRRKHEAYLCRLEGGSAAQAKAAILGAELSVAEDVAPVLTVVGPAETDPYGDVELDADDAEDWEESDQKLSVTGMFVEGVHQFIEHPSEPAEVVKMPVGVRELKPEPELTATVGAATQSERAEALQVIVPFKEHKKVLQYLPVGGCRPTM